MERSKNTNLLYGKHEKIQEIGKIIFYNRTNRAEMR